MIDFTKPYEFEFTDTDVAHESLANYPANGLTRFCRSDLNAEADGAAGDYTYTVVKPGTELILHGLCFLRIGLHPTTNRTSLIFYIRDADDVAYPGILDLRVLDDPLASGPWTAGYRRESRVLWLHQDLDNGLQLRLQAQAVGGHFQVMPLFEIRK